MIKYPFINKGSTGSASWPVVQQAAASGHEIGGHTVNHVDIVTLYKSDTNTLKSELEGCATDIRSHIPGIRDLSFAYPYGSGWQQSADAAAARMFVKRWYINGKGVNGAEGNIGPVGYDRYNDYKTFADYYYQTGGVDIGETVTITTFVGYLESALRNGGWTILMYHTPSAYSRQLDSILARKDSLWITTYGNATRYHKERNTAVMSPISITDSLWTFRLTDGYLPDSIYDHPLTVRMKVPPLVQIEAIKQNGQFLPFRQDTALQFNAVPDNGDVLIYKKDTVYPWCDSNLLAAPRHLTYRVLSSSKIYLSWDTLSANACIKDYEVYMDDMLIATSFINSWTVTGLNDTKIYKFYVKARNFRDKISPSNNINHICTH